MIDVDIKVAQKSAAAEARGAQGDNVGSYSITYIHLIGFFWKLAQL